MKRQNGIFILDKVSTLKKFTFSPNFANAKLGIKNTLGQASFEYFVLFILFAFFCLLSLNSGVFDTLKAPMEDIYDSAATRINLDNNATTEM